jgi:hypothetical protein
MSSESRRTSFFALTGDPRIGIERIEIPQFQRDYAQGREGDAVGQIRTDFLDVLYTAVGDDQNEVGLDFVYGGVEEGTLRPLDGQQRLTTLFLLHWYIASRSGHLAEEHGWKRFSYATRQSARMFCERVVEAPLPCGEVVPSDWIKDQPWYLFLWRHDPTIQSMLVMIDAIHERFREVDAATAWTRFTDIDAPAIWFLLLPLSGLSSSGEQDMRPEDLYIKMNSRGKPLTEFENFKAHFEKTIQSSPRSAEFALKVDTSWSDLLWHLRGDDDLIDDEFLRYLEFITEICEWRDGRYDGAGQRLVRRTPAIFGDENPQREAHLDFLFKALDVWVSRSIQEAFERVFSSTKVPADVSKVRLFFRQSDSQPESLNLFEACCRSYGETRGRARIFSLGQSLALYAVVLHFIEGTHEFPRRIRVLRNLIEASSDELRLDRMPKIIEDVHRIIRHGAIEGVATLNQAQVADEKLKASFLEANPNLLHVVFALEDHELLHGSLGAFELDAATFESRALVFHRVMSQPELWPALLGALLAVGEYQRQRTNARPFLFGTDSRRHENAWRDLLTGATRDRMRPTRKVLGTFLDLVAAASTELDDTLTAITSDYLAQCDDEHRFDWRYYMVKYRAMRENGSSTYVAERTDNSEHLTMGYSLCMLQAGGKTLGGYYRDPYLLAISRQLEDGNVVEDKWFTGSETQPRRLPLTRSGASLRCVASGFELSPPPNDADAEVLAAVGADLGVTADNVVAVPQMEANGRPVDMVDRIQLGADIIRRLVAAGL